MKKFIGTLVMVIALALGVAASAEYTASIEMQDGKIAVNGADSGTLIITSYSENGEKLNGVKTCDISEYKDGVPVNDEFLSLFSDEKTDRVTCMLWNDFAHMEPLAKSLNISDIATIPAGGYDYQHSNNSNGDKLYFYKNGKLVSYKINEDTKLYVNGVIYDDFDSGINRFIRNNDTSDVTLIDCTVGGSADGVYDSVFVNYYDTAVVDDVRNADTDNPAISFNAYTIGAGPRISIDMTDPDKSYRICDTDGNDMDVSEIEQNDVLSIRRDPNIRFADSDFYDIIVSRKTIEGLCTSYDPDEETYIINGNTYSVINDFVDSLDIGVEYKFSVDAFGKIACAEEKEKVKQIAILDAVYIVRGSDFEVSLILEDGSKKTYALRDTLIEGHQNYDIASQILYGAVLSDADLTNKQPIWDRVIEYSVNSFGELTIVHSLEDMMVDGTFSSSTDRLDGLKISREAKILNISDTENICPISYSEFVEDINYSGYVFNRNSKNEYRYVLISSDSALGYYTRTISPRDFDDSVVTENTKLYVNGVEITDVNEGVEKYIKHNNSGSVTLIDRLKDDIIDEISVDYYETAVVDSVSDTETGKFEIVFKNNGAFSNIVVCEEDLGKSYNIFNASGKKYYIGGIDEGDVLSIRRDVSKDFESSGFYDIIVSDKTKEGKHPIYIAETGEYKINGKTYLIADGVTLELDEAKSYMLRLDAFGSIAYAEEIPDSRNIAILNAVYLVRGDECEVSIILPDTTKEEYILSERNRDIASQILYGTVLSDADPANRQPVWGRVIEYAVNELGELTIVQQLNGEYTLEAEKGKGKYDAKASAIDGLMISENTALLNAADENGIIPIKQSLLVDQRQYSVYAYDKSEEDEIYSFVIFTAPSGSFSSQTQLAVYNKRILRTNSENQEVTAAVVFVDGKERQIDIDSNYTLSNLQNGDPVIYETNSQGEITNIIKAANFIDFDNYNYSGYDNIRNVALESTSNVISLAKNSDGNIEALSDDDGDVDIVFGAVFKGENKSIDLLPITNGKSDMSDIISYTCGDDVKFYEYDSNQRRDSVSVGYASDIINLRVPQNAYVDGQNQEFSWDYTDGDGKAAKLNPMFAFIRCVNAEVKEVYLIIPPYEE